MGLTRREFHASCNLNDGDFEMARKVDRLWRDSDTMILSLPMLSMLLSSIVITIPLFAWEISHLLSTSFELRELVLIFIYAAGMTALYRAGQSEGRTAHQQFIDARLQVPRPLPDAWIPVDRTYKNLLWRGFVVHFESVLIETGQLSPEQLGDQPDEYRARVEEATGDLMPAWLDKLEAIADKLAGRRQH